MDIIYKNEYPFSLRSNIFSRSLGKQPTVSTARCTRGPPFSLVPYRAFRHGAVWKTDGPAHDWTRFMEAIEAYANFPDDTTKPNEICAQVYGTCKANVGPAALYMSDRIVDKIKVKRIRPDDSPNTVYVNRPPYPLNPTRVPIATLYACIAVLIPF